MALVDSLLKLVSAQGADALILPPGAVPQLERAGQTTPLSMPVPTPEVVEGIVRQVATPAQQAALAGGTALRTQHGEFAVSIEPRGGSYHLVFRRAGARRARPEPEPAARTAAIPTAPRVSGGTPGGASALGRILLTATERGASDVLVSAGQPARARIGGQMVSLAPLPPCTEAELEALLALGESDRAELAAQGSCDVSVDLRDAGGARYRVHVFRQRCGLTVAFRPVSTGAPTLDELGLPDDLYELAELPAGLVLFVGAAGSGKSTSLVALIERLNRRAARHIVTLEDPVEHIYTPQQSLIHQREIGRDVDSFATGLRAALRESPDVILLGEMRDQATIAAALTAAETGHLVLSTLHSRNASAALHRIVDVFPAHQQDQVRHQLADSLRAVVTQQLLPSTSPPRRVPAYEKLVVNTAVSTKIREGRGHQLGTELQKGRTEGMVSWELSLARLVRAGRIDRATAIRHAPDPTLLEQLL